MLAFLGGRCAQASARIESSRRLGYITRASTMMQDMRTTIDLPPAVHRRVRELAAQRGQSLSSVVADLTVRGLAQLDAPVELSTDARTGLPVLSLGRRITSEEVADVLDDE